MYVCISKLFLVFTCFFGASKDKLCVGWCARVLGPQIPSDSWSQDFCIDACLPLSPLFFISPLISPFPTLHAYLLSDPPLCVVYTLHLACSSLFSIPFYLFQMSGKKSLFHLIFTPPPFPHLILSQGPGKWGGEKERVENGKWGPYSCSSLLFFFLYAAFLPEGRVCRTYLRREKRKEKNAVEEWEMVQNSREQRGRESQKAIFFFEGLSGRVESEKRRDKRREEECGGVKSVYLSKESDSRLPANNPFLLLHFSPTP